MLVLSIFWHPTWGREWWQLPTSRGQAVWSLKLLFSFNWAWHLSSGALLLLSQLSVQSNWPWRELPLPTYSVPRKTIWKFSCTVQEVMCLLKKKTSENVKSWPILITCQIVALNSWIAQIFLTPLANVLCTISCAENSSYTGQEGLWDCLKNWK